MKKKGITLLEVLVAAVVMAIIIIPTIDFMSSFVKAEADFNSSIKNKEDKLNLSDKIAGYLKPASYIYQTGTTLTIPTSSSTTTVKNGQNSIAFLIPEFNTDGTLVMPTSTTTKFTGVAFSIIPEEIWDGKNTEKYMLIQTNFKSSTLYLPTDTNDSLILTASPPLNWSTGSSYIMADNLKPAIFDNMGTNAFNIASSRDKATFAFIPKADYLYFPSNSGQKTLDDSEYLTNINLRNWRQTTY